MKITKRLEEVSNLIEEGASVLDVGTDHGYLPLFLEEKGYSKKLVASDISRPSLEKLIDKLDENSRIEAMLLDGLDYLKTKKMDYVTICGMGSRLIISILEKAKDYRENANYYIFQPNTTIDELRFYLLENGITIIDEVALVEEGVYYNIIKAGFGEELSPYEDYEVKYSRILLEKKDQDTLDYLKKEESRFRKIWENKKLSEVRREEVRKELELIERAMKRYEL